MHLAEASAPHFEPFKASFHFPEMLKALGPKYLVVTREDDEAYCEHVVLDGELIVGRGDPRDDGRKYLQLWRDGDDSRVSREHCRLDAGPMMLIVTDLGSTSGTRYTPTPRHKKGSKIKCDSLPPGRALYLGAYILTYKLGEVPPTPTPKGPKKGLLSRFSRSKKSGGPQA